MSPEQASGGDLDERTDVFALGGVLYYLLSRQPPFDGASIEEILARARSCSFAPLRELASPSRELDRIVSRALAASPEDRYPGVNELKEDLVAFVRGGALPTAHFEQGQVIVAEGEIGDEAYLVVTGSCEVSKSSGGQRTVIRTLGPGECFGETAILAAAPRSASVVALEDTVVQVVSREELQEELGIVSPWMSVFLRSLAERFLERELPTGG